MQIRKWRHQLKLFVWQRKRNLILLGASVAALGICAALAATAAAAGSTQWLLLTGSLAVAGLVISLAVAIFPD